MLSRCWAASTTPTSAPHDDTRIDLSANTGPIETDWFAHRERIRPEDGATVRRWSRARYDLDAQLEHTEDRYEIARAGVVLAAQEQRRSPATRWYTHEQVRALYAEAGFTDVALTREWSGEPAVPEDGVITAVGTKP